MKKLIALSVILSLFTFGCCKNDCPPAKLFFDINKVNLQVYSISNKPPDYNYQIATDSVSFEALVLKANYEVTYYSSVPASGFSLVPSALACDMECARDGQSGTKEKIESINLVALTDYNTKYKAGSSLNPIAHINGKPLQDFIAYQNQYNLLETSFEMRLTDKPDRKIKHAFRLEFKLTNGELYISETTPLLIY